MPELIPKSGTPCQLCGEDVGRDPVLYTPVAKDSRGEVIAVARGFYFFCSIGHKERWIDGQRTMPKEGK